MYKKSINFFRFAITAVILFASLAGASGVLAGEGDPLKITLVDPLVECDDVVQFTIEWTENYDGYMFFMVFGDEEDSDYLYPTESPMIIKHTYPNQGDFEWTVQVGETDYDEVEDTMTGLLTLEGPEVVLSSDPELPLFVLGDPPGTVEFSVKFFTEVTGGVGPYVYKWDLDGGVETGEPATYAYTEVDKYYPQVQVTDSCGFTASDTMPVVVIDPEDACHPMAEKIAEGVNTYLFPSQSEDIYTCDDIYKIFDNESEENNLGFGLMWKAYHLAESMEILTWEDIMDWKLDQGGWGALLQLDRFADLLEDHDLVELMGLVMSEQFTLGDVRVAVRSTTRYEADFTEVLARIAEVANPGELGQFYKLANELEADPTELDFYLTAGLTLSEIKHAASFADRMEGVDWTEIADSRSMADSWGDLKQAYTLAADGGVSAAQILSDGVQAYKKSLQEEALTVREENQATQQDGKNLQTAERLAEQSNLNADDIMSLLNSDECTGSWACVRKALRVQVQTLSAGYTDKDYQIALQLEAKYGLDDGVVLKHHTSSCDEDWTCTRAHFRELYMDNRENGKPDKDRQTR